jgi:hypothetical protein
MFRRAAPGRESFGGAQSMPNVMLPRAAKRLPASLIHDKLRVCNAILALLKSGPRGIAAREHDANPLRAVAVVTARKTTPDVGATMGSDANQVFFGEHAEMRATSMIRGSCEEARVEQTGRSDEMQPASCRDLPGVRPLPSSAMKTTYSVSSELRRAAVVAGRPVSESPCRSECGCASC